MGQIVVYCQGRTTVVEQNETDGSYLCPRCGKRGVSVIGVSELRPANRPADAQILELDFDDPTDAEKRNRDASRIDFDSPFRDAA